MKHETTAVVCRYVMRQLRLSGRAMARELGVHHRTWQRYVDGSRRPPKEVKSTLARLMQVDAFIDLIRMAWRHRVKPF